MSTASSKVVVLKPVNEGRFAHTITQEDCLEFQQLSREFTDARKAWEAKRDFLKAALRGGAGIEPGALTAELVRGTRGCYEVAVSNFEKVVVR